jgi:peptidoglycan hydrolase-like protein with peptidoglycan-binding domain
MRQIFACAAMLVMAVLAWSAQPAPPAKKAAPKTTGVRKAPGKTGTAAHSTATAKKGTTTARRPVATWRNRQLAPTPERYRQIQQALASKGYLKPEEATGKWDQNSVDAMKRFQAEQNLESTGKVNSLSLIALGLGPKHEATVVKPPAPGPAQDPLSGRE